ncbi:MAG: phosphate ABC transporter substrate-binding protein [Pseudomonadota bacterium]|nr:phosphate ABC transporter substrate-binding protein [Pseudomonadota bacterium]
MRAPRPTLPALLAAALLVFPGLGRADEVYVISNGVVAMTPEEVKEVFLGESQFSGAQKLQPVDNAGAQAQFLAHVLNISAPKYSTIWMKKAFRDGLNAPPLKATDVEVLNFVRSHPGAIGYTASEPQGVHVIGRY